MEESQDIKPDTSMKEILATAFLHSLFQFLRMTELHKADNKIFDDCTTNLLRTLQNFFAADDNQEGITLTFRGEHIFVNRTRLRPKPRQFYVYRFILKFMRLRRIGTFVVKTQPTADEVRLFLWHMARAFYQEGEKHPVDVLNEQASVQKIKSFEVHALAKLNIGGAKSGQEESGLDDVEVAAAFIYEELRKFTEICLDNLENAARFQSRKLSDLMTDLSILSEEDLVQMLRLVSVKRYDRPFPYRAVNSCFLMSAWAYSLKLPRGVIMELAQLALLHPLSLDDEGLPPRFDQRLLVFEKLDRLKEVWPATELQSLALAEWGIPFGNDGVYDVNGTKCYLHFFSRMLRIIADFEMLTTYHSKRRVFLPDEALTEMLSRKGIYDQTLLKLFVNWLGVYPVGTLVALQTGEIAQVFAGASDPTKFTRPLVMILKDAKGKILERPEIYDLTEMNEKLGTYKKSIRRSLTIEESGIPADHFKMTPVGF